MIILASKSTGRLATLRAAGIEPLVRVSDVDEGAVLQTVALDRGAAGLPGASAVEQVQALAVAKARAVAADLGSAPAQDPGPTPALVVGCDSMLEIDGEVVGKPRSAQAARERWLAMRGRSGVLHSGHAVIRLGGARAGGEEMVQGVSSTLVHFGEPSLEEIDAYVSSGEPIWCAGAFTIDGLGGAFVKGIEGDPHGVVGISLPLLRSLVGRLGVRWTDLWNRVP